MQFKQFPRWFTALSVFCCSAALATAAPLPLVGVPNFYKVDNQVYRGAQPSLEGFASLAKLGVKTIIDLREIGEHSQGAEEAMVKAQGMHYLSIPFKMRTAPSAELISRVLGLLNDTNIGPVFVHCKRGADRTGAVIACYRISHDSWDGKRALAEARDNGMSMFQGTLQHYVLHFEPIPAVQSVQAASAAAPAQ